MSYRTRTINSSGSNLGEPSLEEGDYFTEAEPEEEDKLEEPVLILPLP